MSFIDTIRSKVDTWQQAHSSIGFVYAVIKKYGEDDAGYKAALLTYYAFLALFPLLLVLTTVATIIAGRNEQLRETILGGLTSYFPAFGEQLATIGTIEKSGIALAIGILFSLYGARGVADAFRTGVNKIWHVPRIKRDTFPKSLLKSMTIILVGGSGFLLASISATYTAAAGRGIGFRLLAITLNLAILFGLFMLLLKLSLPGRVTFRDTKAGAAAAAIGIVALQAAGGFILSRELQNLNTLYSNFAIPLGLLFWLYLQAQVLFYAIEIAAVRSQKLWPRAIDISKPTAADKRAYTKIPASEQYLPTQKITSQFRKG